MPENPVLTERKMAVCSAEFNYTEKCQTPIPCFWSPSRYFWSHLFLLRLFVLWWGVVTRESIDWTYQTGHWSFLAFPPGKIVGHKEVTLLICLWLQLYKREMYELVYLILSFTNNKSKSGWLKDYHRDITQYRMQYLPNLMSPVTYSHESKERKKCIRFHAVWSKFSFEDPFPWLSDSTFSQLNPVINL